MSVKQAFNEASNEVKATLDYHLNRIMLANDAFSNDAIDKEHLQGEIRKIVIEMKGLIGQRNINNPETMKRLEVERAASETT